MLAFSLPSLLPYFILCLVLNTKITAVFDFKFKRRPSQKVLLSKLPSTDSLSNSPAPSSPGEVFQNYALILINYQHQLDRSLSHTMFKLHFTRSTEYVIYQLISSQCTIIIIQLLLSLSLLMFVNCPICQRCYIWLSVAFVCSIPHPSTQTCVLPCHLYDLPFRCHQFNTRIV